LADDRIAALDEAGWRKRLEDVPLPNPTPVEPILAFSGAVEPPSDGHLVELKGEQASVVVEDEGHFGVASRWPATSSRKEKILGFPDTQASPGRLRKHPADSVREVALATPIWADHCGQLSPELEPDPARERLESG
jgi:hypothetical protein